MEVLKISDIEKWAEFFDYKITIARNELVELVADIWKRDPTIITQGMYLGIGLKAANDYPLN